MKKILLLALSLQLSFAKDVRTIKKGEASPYDGYVFDLEAEQINQRQLREFDNMKYTLDLLKENQVDLLKDRNMWKDVAQENTERLVKLEHNTFWQNTIYFGLGTILTGALAIGLSRGLNR